MDDYRRRLRQELSKLSNANAEEELSMTMSAISQG